MKTYLNGQMLDEAQALVSSQDAGFQHGVGLFETMFASRTISQDTGQEPEAGAHA